MDRFISISTNSENKFSKIQHLLMMKLLHIVGITKIYLRILKTLCQKSAGVPRMDQWIQYLLFILIIRVLSLGFTRCKKEETPATSYLTSTHALRYTYIQICVHITYIYTYVQTIKIYEKIV